MRLPASTLLVALALAALPAAAQPRDWSALTRLKPGATILVYTRVYARDPTVDDGRCILVSVDASTLSCVSYDGPVSRLVYPAAQIYQVYQIKSPRHLTGGLILGLAIAGTFIGGLASGNPLAIGVGVLGLIIACALALPPPPFAPWGYPPPPPPQPPTERFVLVYQR